MENERTDDEGDAAPMERIPAAAERPAAAARGHRRFAQVTGIDASKGLVSVKDKRGRRRSFKVTRDTLLTRGGHKKRASLRRLKIGDWVHYVLEGGRAARLHINVVYPKNGGRAEAAADSDALPSEEAMDPGEETTGSSEESPPGDETLVIDIQGEQGGDGPAEEEPAEEESPQPEQEGSEDAPDPEPEEELPTE